MDTETQLSLFEPFRAGNLTINNRIVMAPMTRSRAIGSIPNNLMATYYTQRASAGLIITEGVAPSPNGLGYARIPGIFNTQQVEGWKKITEAVHAEGSKIFIQLMHTGRIAHPANLPEEATVVAPSAVRANSNMWTDESGMQPLPVPEAMSEDNVRQTIQEFTTAAEHAVEAGFDGVELHGANGYLLEQFLNPNVNIRTDAYGGSVENRIRVALEATESVANAIGAERTGIRLSPYNTFNDMPEYPEVFETYETLIRKLNEQDITYIHIVESAARSHEKGQELLSEIREIFKGLIMVNGGYTREKAEEVLEEERADLISFGTPFIANPDFPKRLEKEIPLTQPDRNTFYSADDKGYIDYSIS